jgi:hypothetical protein
LQVKLTLKYRFLRVNNMLKIFKYYTIIGLTLAPFIYFNNAWQYRENIAGGIGGALGGAFYWPSYFFSIEPRLDGESVDSFEKSIMALIDYRNDKLFTGKRSPTHARMVVTAIGNCLAVEGKKNNTSFIYDQMFSDDKDLRIEKIRATVIQKMDGYDFSDIIDAGAKCGEEYQSL